MPHLKRAWTVLGYIVADHSGATADIRGADIDQVAMDEAENMRRSARGLNDMYLAVQVDFSRTPGVWRMDPDNPKGKSLTEEESGGADGLRKFIEGIKEEYPADHYMLVLWGHGAGPVGLFDDPDTGPARDNSPESVSLRELRTVLRAFGAPNPDKPPLDILLVKSCCMATAEAAFEVCEFVQYMLCSQAKVPIRTWTVWDVFDELTDPKGDALPVARALLDGLDRHYARALERNERKEIPFTLIATPHIWQVKNAIATLCKVLPPSMAASAAVQAALASGRPGEPGDNALVDLVDVCTALSRLPDPEVAEAARQALDTLRIGGPLVNSHRPANSVFHGLSAFCVPPIELRVTSFADDMTSIEYERLAFCQATGWHRVAFASEFARATTLTDPTPAFPTSVVTALP